MLVLGVKQSDSAIFFQIKFISHASKVMLKVLQARLQQYVNCEIPDIQAGFRKGWETRDQIANILRTLLLSPGEKRFGVVPSQGQGPWVCGPARGSIYVLILVDDLLNSNAFQPVCIFTLYSYSPIPAFNVFNMVFCFFALLCVFLPLLSI